MTDERLIALLREALPPVSAATPSRDLWLAVAEHGHSARWSWIDLGIAGGVCAAFFWRPAWFVWLSYHF